MIYRERRERKGRWGLTKKMMEGEAARAFLKTSLTARSDSPTYLLSNYDQRVKGQKEVSVSLD